MNPPIDLFSLHGRRALITGSGQGIGLTLARGLAAAGAEIVLNDIDAARLDQAVASLRGEGLVVEGRAFGFLLHLSYSSSTMRRC